MENYKGDREEVGRGTTKESEKINQELTKNVENSQEFVVMNLPHLLTNSVPIEVNPNVLKKNAKDFQFSTFLQNYLKQQLDCSHQA